MKKGMAIFLQTIIILLGICSLVFLLWEPHLEGRNAHATLFQIYFNDAFLAYVYAVSIIFFVMLYKAFRLVGYIGQDKKFSIDSTNALQTIKYCAISLIVFITAPVVYLLIVRPGDDIAGGVAIGVFLIMVFSAVALTATTYSRTLRKDENKL